MTAVAVSDQGAQVTPRGVGWLACAAALLAVSAILDAVRTFAPVVAGRG